MALSRLDADIFPCRVEGWLNVWSLDVGDAEVESVSDGFVSAPTLDHPVFDPRFCVLCQWSANFSCFTSEKSADDEACDQPHLLRLRLDGGKEEFDRRWGYETLESIKENAIQHLPASSYNVSTENIFRNKAFNGIGESKQVFTETSYEKVHVATERRGSAPLVTSGFNADEMDGVSGSNKFSTFFSKKGFIKSNLKRTKSVTKLDRKRSVAPITDNDPSSGSNFMSSLKRSMSLGRLTRKRNSNATSTTTTTKPGNKAPPDFSASHPLSLISSRIRSSRSHESLLTNPAGMHAIDLTAEDVEIKPLHSSILGQDHCFQISTSNGSKYISCRTAEEREKWIESLRKTVHPNQEQTRRTDNSLKIWVVEAKNVPSKKRYFCEICLDKTLYARTSPKSKMDMLFWGEHFEFNNLPSVEIVTVNLFREADKKKKKDKNTLIGYINIPVCDVSNRHFVEKWYSTRSGTVGKSGKENRCEVPLLRLKARYQTVQILPMDSYKGFIDYLTTDYCTLCDALEPVLSVREKEDISRSLIHIMQRLGKAKRFLADVVMTEIGRLDNEQLTFRGNSIATKAMESYMKLLGEKYLQDTLGEFIRTIIEMPDDCEVDPTKVTNNSVLQRHQTNLNMYCQMAWVKIINSYCYFPSDLKDVFSAFRQCCEEKKKDDIADHLISASIFLRFLCPAILSPSLFNLTQEFPQEKSARNLTLIAKTIQTLANFTKFGAKEEFMTFMNQFVEQEWMSMKNFLQKISSNDTRGQFLEFDGYIDLGKELSILHSLLTESVQKIDESVTKLDELKEILAQIKAAHDDPSVGSKRVSTSTTASSRQSQIYDNLTNLATDKADQVPINNNSYHGYRVVPVQTTTSPTEVLRDMLRECGEDMDLLNLEPSPPNTINSRDSGICSTSSRKNVPMTAHRSYNDDYGYVRSRVPPRIAPCIGDVSASTHSLANDRDINESWTQIVDAADLANGEYVDLVSLMDDITDEQNSSLELERDMRGSQVSISQLSTIASSGYQSFGYSQSSSPVDSGVHQDRSLPPLSFSNPLYQHRSSGVRSAKVQRSGGKGVLNQASSSSSLSSSEDSNTMKDNITPCRSQQDVSMINTKYMTDPLRALNPMSSSSSSDSLNQDELVISSLAHTHSLPRSSQYSTYGNSYSQQQQQQYHMKNHHPSNHPHSYKTNYITRHQQQQQQQQQHQGPDPRRVPLILRSSSPIHRSPATGSVTSRTMAANSCSSGSNNSITRSNNCCISASTPQQASSNLSDNCFTGMPLRSKDPLSQSLDISSLQYQQKAQRALPAETFYVHRHHSTGNAESQFSYHNPSQVSSLSMDAVFSPYSNTPLAPGGASSSQSGSSSSPPDSPLCYSQHHVSQNGFGVSRHVSGDSVEGGSSISQATEDKCTQEYEAEVLLLRQQLAEAQRRLQEAEARLAEHEVGSESSLHEWRHKLEVSEDRMRRQRVEKDDHMKNIIHRLVTVEGELRTEQTEMHKLIGEKQKVIDNQEEKIILLDSANIKLLSSLTHLKDRFSGGKNGIAVRGRGEMGLVSGDTITLQNGGDEIHKSSAC